MKQKQCTFLPDTAEDFLPTSSLDTRQLSLLSGTDTPARYSENEQQTAGFPDCKCGKGTFDCLIHPSTPEEWTSFMQDSLAKTLALLGSRQALLKEPDQVFTEKSCGSLAWFDQSSSSWKTYQQSLVTGWEPYSETWPRWGMTQGGSAFVHPMSERRITETDGLLWLTPRVLEVDESVENFRARMNKKRPNDRKNGFASLSMQVKAGFKPMWPTPRANSAMASTITPESAWDSKRFPNLETMVGRQMWPTPQARDYRSGDRPDSPRAIRKRQQGWSPNLNDVVMWPTPTARIHKGGGKQMTRKDGKSRMDMLDWNVESQSDGGRLNPMWVEWLMGFPIGFTDSKDWETRKSRFKRQQPIDSSGESDAP